MKVAETPDLPFVLRLSVEQHKRQNQQIYILCLPEKSPLPFGTFVIYYCNSWISSSMEIHLSNGRDFQLATQYRLVTKIGSGVDLSIPSS